MHGGPLLNRTYDAVVVGSGVNGLACAALLARAGRRVCVLERNDWFGGTIKADEITVPGQALRWEGLYDLEIFSDAELPDSLWKQDPRELARRGVEALSSVFA